MLQREPCVRELTEFGRTWARTEHRIGQASASAGWCLWAVTVVAVLSVLVSVA